jgi:FtsZ-binding cell division protein ZapB
MIAKIALFLCISTIIMVIVLTRFYLKLQELKYKNRTSSNEDASEMKQQLGHVMAENDEMKEELRNIKYFLSQDKRFIDIKEYEKEQIRLDLENKMNS